MDTKTDMIMKMIVHVHYVLTYCAYFVYYNNLLTVSSEDFRLTEHAEWILEQRNEYKNFIRKLEGMYLLILKWECMDNVKIDFTGI